jgi:hypothetical protein
MRSTEVNKQTAYDVQHWSCCVRLAEKRQVRVHLLGVKKRLVASSHPIPDGVVGMFHCYNSSGRTTALGSTQHLIEMSTRDISWGCNCGRCSRLNKFTTIMSQLSSNLENSTSWNIQWLSRPVEELLYIVLITKPMRCTNFSNLFWNRNLHVSDNFSVHRQESSTVHTAIHTGYTDCLLGSSQHNPYDMYILLCVQC